MKKIITYGTFDLLHWGHILLLQRAKNLGDYLIVALSTDEFNLVKQKVSFFNYEKRKLMLDAIQYVDEVIPEFNWEQKALDIQNNQVDILVMGDDWKGQFDYLKPHCEVMYLERTKGISSTIIKKRAFQER
ncbi:glycerol-3-phosphate cytidylyltransferase [Listeria ilorinensis]|uniref:glycerol-3-phosphate cytidylyltransferase n=1 Tax=Listeria ilorinensis TaxID=2867439 RepID=UPI001EF48936|nr:glycerol-3-phosphate cytidylyltransferase [Listeria ilorinensis]